MRAVKTVLKLYCKFIQLIKRGTEGLMIVVALRHNVLTLKVEIEQKIWGGWKPTNLIAANICI